MSKRGKNQKRRHTSGAKKRADNRLWSFPKRYWSSSIWHKALIIFLVLVGLIVGTMYGIARWYMWQERDVPMVLGATFVPGYAQSLGLDPHQTLHAMLDDLQIKHLRLVSHWDVIEPQPGKYDFSELDWEFQKANKAHATVSLSIGLRQPRWPECHVPAWVNMSQPREDWQPELEQYIQTVVERYRNNPALRSYQLENEYFLKVFGKCTDFSRDRLVSEFNLVKSLDPYHTVIIARSNNALGMPIYAPVPDESGFSVYKRVWDQTITHRYIEYPFPAWYYGFLAGLEKIVWGRDTIIHELQAEPWPPRNVFVANASIAEQNKSMNAKILKARIGYGEATGMKEIYLWGAEWWYWRLVKAHDPSEWNVVKQAIQQANGQG